MKFFYLVLVSFYASLVGFYFWGKEHRVQFNYPSKTLYPIVGLDVSHHQGEIDWSKIDVDTYKFVYLKATEGLDFKDKKFKHNYNLAKKSGIKVGAYHFWSFCKDPLKQIDNIIDTVPKSSGDLVPALDMETIQKCSFTNIGIEAQTIESHLKIAIKELKLRFGKEPVIYTTMDFISQHKNILNSSAVYWVRSLVAPPFLSNKAWELWQFHNSGDVLGIEGPVDLNVVREPSTLKLLSQP